MVQKFVGVSLRTALLLSASCLTLPALAQSLEGAVQDETLRTLVVTASRTEQSLMDVTRSVAVVEKEQIEQQNANDVADLLRDIPGVAILEGASPGLRRISIRGEGQARNTILIDGQEVSDHSTYGSLFMIDPANIERVEVVKGPSSVLHGSKAIGGVVNIITKKGADKPLEISIGGGYDSSTGGYQSNASAAGSSDDWDYRLSLTKSDHGDRKSGSGTLKASALTNGSAFENQSISANIGYSHGNHSLRLVAEKVDMASDAYVDPKSLSAARTAGLSKFILDLPKRDRTKFGVFYDGTDLNDVVKKVHMDAYIQQIERVVDIDFTRATPNRATFPFGTEISTKNKTSDDQVAIGFNSQIDLTLLDNHLTIFGAQIVHDSVDRNDKRNGTNTRIVFNPRSPNFSYNPAGRPSLINDNFDKEASITTFSAFVQDEWSVSDDFSITGGLRYFYIDSELSKTNQPGYAPFSKSDDAFIGSLGVNYTGIDNVALRGNISQGYVYPTLLQNMLGSVFSPGNVIEANPNLKAEKSINYEIGARFDNGVAMLDAAAFYSVAEDYIDSVSCGRFGAVCTTAAASERYVNIDEATTYGLEVSGSYHLQAWSLTPYFSATLMTRDYKASGIETNNTDIPAFTGRFGVRKYWDLDDDIEFMSDLYIRTASERELNEPSSRDYEKHAAFTTLNFASSLTYQFSEERSLRLNASVENIFDKSYTESLSSTPAAGRAFKLSGQLTF
ncbi:MAG: TonB-dependent receptor [Cohaesibacter sp.]|nr:TonB-dependent receptor [Cohaesibacter sp.]